MRRAGSYSPVENSWSSQGEERGESVDAHGREGGGSWWRSGRLDHNPEYAHFGGGLVNANCGAAKQMLRSNSHKARQPRAPISVPGSSVVCRRSECCYLLEHISLRRDKHVADEHVRSAALIAHTTSERTAPPASALVVATLLYAVVAPPLDATCRLGGHMPRVPAIMLSNILSRRTHGDTS